MSDAMTEPTFYEQIGGHETIARIVEVFYEGVATDEVLRPLYPEEDLGPAAARFTMFLVQYWGGPGDYSAERGHPKLRMRHLRFPIDTVARDRWLEHMSAAVAAGTRQDATRRPSTCTEQAPHSPSAQPSLAPVSPEARRKSSSEVWTGTPSSGRDPPFTDTAGAPVIGPL